MYDLKLSKKGLEVKISSFSVLKVMNWYSRNLNFGHILNTECVCACGCLGKGDD